jgi:hypothetical protein
MNYQSFLASKAAAAPMLGLALLGLAACGGNSGGSTDNVVPAAPAVTPPPTAPVPVAPVPVIPVASSSSSSSSSSSGSSSGSSTSSSSSSSSGSSSSSSSSSSSGVNQAIGGIWTQTPPPTYPDGTPATDAVDIQMLITETGEFFYATPVLGAGTYVYTGNVSVAGSTVTGAQYQSFEYKFCEYGNICSADPPVSISGTVSQRSTLTLAGVDWIYNDLYNQPSSLAAIAGNWAGPIYESGVGAGYGILNISSTGAFNAPYPSGNCVFSGQIALINPAYNAYAVSLSYAGSGCDPVGGSQITLNGTTGKGIATIDNSVSPSVLQIVVTLTNSAGGVSGIGTYQETQVQQ